MIGLALPLLLAAAAAGAQERPAAPGDPAERSIRAAPRRGPIALDGRLDEEAWRSAEVGGGLTQTAPRPGAPASEATRFRILFDDDSVYVGVECDDSQPPTVRLSRRDRRVDSDFVAWDFDTTRDRRTAFHFQVFASGQQVDGLHYDDTELSYEWDAAWESAVHLHPKGWSVEARIPLRVLRIPPGATAFGFDLQRRLTRLNEETRWRWRPREAPGEVSQLGLLAGLDGLRPRRALELRPYLATSGARASPQPAPLASPLAAGPCTSVGITPQGLATTCAGADLRYTLDSDLALVATASPDFGQVEADDRVLNLSTFETFYPEKRPFFVEGLELFEPPLKTSLSGSYGGDAYQLFYSRRLGRAPQEPSLDGGEQLLYLPRARPIATAVKVSGTLGDTSVGALAALEPRVSAQVLDANGRVRSARAEEAAFSAALRLRAPVGQHLLAGVGATSTDPLFAQGQALHAHVGSGDLTLFDSRRNWSFTAVGSASRLDGNERTVRRDGVLVPPGASGYALSAKLAKNAGRLIGFAGADLLSPTFEVNALGFMRRANLVRTLGKLQLRSLEPNGLWQSALVAGYVRAAWNSARDVALHRSGGLDLWVQLNSGWITGGGAYGELPAADDRELGDGTPVERQPASGLYAFVTSDTRRAFSGGLTGSLRQEFPLAASSWDVSADVAYRPAPSVETALTLALHQEDGALRVVRGATLPPGPGVDPTESLDRELAQQQTRLYLLAPQHARSASASLRATMAFTPRLSLQAYAQLFTAAVSYDAAQRALAPPGRAPLSLGALAPALPEDQAPGDLSTRDAGLDLSLVLRWEWTLGSTVYLVYTRQSATSLTVAPGLSFPDELATFVAPGGRQLDTLLVKVDRLLGL